MLVDDEESALYLHQLVLRESSRIGHIHTFQSAADALDFLQAAPHDIHVVFLDIYMPGMDGFEFLDAYELLDIAHKAENVVALLTSSLRKTDRERARERGLVQTFVEKPLHGSDLDAVLDGLYPDTSPR